MRTRREPKLPTRYGRSKSGRCYFYVIHTSKRDRKGRRLYRLRYLVWGQVDRHRLWTAEELLAETGKWLKRAPAKKLLERLKAAPPPWLQSPKPSTPRTNR